MSKNVMKTVGILTLLFSAVTYIWLSEVPSSYYIAGFKLGDEAIDWVEKTSEELSLYEKCAQLVIPYAYGFDTTRQSDEYSRIVELTTKYKVGGFLFLAGSTEAQTELIDELQSLAKTPLLISADYERGPGMRLNGMVEFPTNMALGAADDPQLTYSIGKSTAIISRELGVHQNYAPLVDVNSDYRNPIINIRAFADNPFNIAVHASAFINGMNDGRMISTAKHFPGHGSTETDSHSELPVISKSVTEFEKSDLIPFREAVSAGVKSVMVGHLQVPAFEKEAIPATFSKNVIENLLENDLGFEGLVITDALNMYAIADNYNPGDAAVNAIIAGNDLVLFPSNDSAAIYGIYQAVLNGKISEERIDRSVRKILAAKSWLGLNENRYSNLKKALDENQRMQFGRLAKTAAEKSVTLVKDEGGILPVDFGKFDRISSIALTDLTERESIKEPLYFNELVEHNIAGAKTFKLHLRSRTRDYRKAYALAKKSDLIFLPIYSAVRSFQNEIGLSKKYIDLINSILQLGKPVITVSFGDPYILKDVPNLPTYLCAYGSVDVSEEAALSAIAGEIKITGKLPVSIPDTPYKRGTGIIKNARKVFIDSSSDSLYYFGEVDSLIYNAVEDSVFPGAVLLIGKNGRVLYEKAYGHYTYDKTSPAVSTNNLFDLASVSKTVGTTSAAMLLYDKGLLDLDKYVIEYLPKFDNNGKDKIKVRNLLLHNAGLPAWIPFYKYFSTKQQVIDSIMNVGLEYEPDTKYVYSDLGMITLQLIIEKISRKSLDEFLRENLFEPLEMRNTLYNPGDKLKEKCVPTEIDDYWRKRLIQGEVHDETAFLLGGVAGHAGLFSTAEDISHLIFTLLNNGEYNGRRIFNAKTVEEWTSKQSGQSTRGLGWDTKSKNKSSAGHFFSMNSFGHTGFTGTSVWADKNNGLFVIFLTNRVYPTRANRKIISFRPLLHDAVFKACE